MALVWWPSAIFTPPTPRSVNPIRSLRPKVRAEAVGGGGATKKKKVVVVGSGWSGLASAHHLTKQGFDVTVLETGTRGQENAGVGGNGFWYPYQNIFSLMDELGIQPFTSWTKSGQYSPEGLQVEFPVFKDLSQLPAPLGAFLYPQFLQLPLVDRLTALPLMIAVIDFDNTDIAWQKYDAMTATELFKQFGCSERLYQEVFNPMLQVSLLTMAEQCSAAATLGVIYYYSLSHQKNFDVRWCRGTIWEKIFKPWTESMKISGCKFHEGWDVLGFLFNEDDSCISGVACNRGILEADAVILAVGISSLQSIVNCSPILQTRQEFLNVLNLSSIDVISVKLWMDGKVDIPNPSNICYGFHNLSAWTLFDMNAIYDEHEAQPATVIKADFCLNFSTDFAFVLQYRANQLLPLEDNLIVQNLYSYLCKCIKGFQDHAILRNEVVRYPKSATHFSPGSYKYMMRGTTTFPNLFVAGDWVVTRHGSWSQEKEYVTGLEAANRVIDYFGEGDFAKIRGVEDDEAHIETVRELNRRINELKAQSPFSGFFMH